MTYCFYVRLEDGSTVYWRGLSRKQARDMYAYTRVHLPTNVVEYEMDVDTTATE